MPASATRSGDHAVDPLAGEPDGASVGRVKFHDAVEDRCLAGAVGPDDAVDGAFLDLEIELVDGDKAAEVLRHHLRLEQDFARLVHVLARSALPCEAPCLDGRGFGIDLHLAALGGRWPKPLRLEAHDGDDGQSIEQEAEFAELAQGFRKTDQHCRAERHARKAAHAADDDQCEDVDRDDELKRMRVDGAEHGGEDRPGKTGKSGAQAIGEKLDADEVDAERLGYVFIVADRHPGASQARLLEPPSDIGSDQSMRRASNRRATRASRRKTRRWPAAGSEECPSRRPAAEPPRRRARSP